MVLGNIQNKIQHWIKTFFSYFLTRSQKKKVDKNIHL